MPDDHLIFNGVSMTPDWPARILAAQKIEMATVAGSDFSRIRFGEEKRDWGADAGPCHDCGVVKGQFHVPGCDVERSPRCGGQFISCDCSDDPPDVKTIPLSPA